MAGKISLHGEHLGEILAMLMGQGSQPDPNSGGMPGFDGTSYDASGPLGAPLTGPPAGGTPPPPDPVGRPINTTPGPGDPGSTDEWGNLLGVNANNQTTWSGKTMQDWQGGGGLPSGWYMDPQGTLRQGSKGMAGLTAANMGAGHGIAQYGANGQIGGFFNPERANPYSNDKSTWAPEIQGSWNESAPGGDIYTNWKANQASLGDLGYAGNTGTWGANGTDPTVSKVPRMPIVNNGNDKAPPLDRNGQPMKGHYVNGIWKPDPIDVPFRDPLGPPIIPPTNPPDTGGLDKPKGGPIDDATGGIVPPAGGAPPPDVYNPLHDPKTKSGFDGTSYDAASNPGFMTAASGSFDPLASSTLGAGTYPWLERYKGEMTAPMSKEQNAGLSATGNFVGGGMGLGGANSYLNSVLGGKYLDVTGNPYIQGIGKAAQGLKDYQDSGAQRRIQSSMAAGGNALSGATSQALGDYSNNSNNQFQQMMNSLYNDQYSKERGYMNQAPGQLNSLAQTQMGGLNSYMNMASIPQQLQQQNDTAQYQDWLRQIGAMNSQSKYGDQLAQQMLSNGKYGTVPAGTAGASEFAQLAAALGLGSSGGGLLQSLFGSGKDGEGGGLGGLLKSIFGGGGTPNGAPAGDPQSHTPDGGSWSAFNEDPNSPDYNPDTSGWGNAGDLWGSDYGLGGTPGSEGEDWTESDWMNWLGDNGMGGTPGSEG